MGNLPVALAGLDQPAQLRVLDSGPRLRCAGRGHVGERDEALARDERDRVGGLEKRLVPAWVRPAGRCRLGVCIDQLPLRHAPHLYSPVGSNWVRA